MTHDHDPSETVADAAMEAKMRQIWAAFPEADARRTLRKLLPLTPVEALGARFIVDPRDNFTEFTMWEAGLPPEHEATAYLADLLRGSDPVIVDVGANAGAFFLPIHLAGGASRSVVFEPNPEMRLRLARNIGLNAVQQDVVVYDCAVSDVTGRSRLYFPRNGNLGQGRVSVPYPHKRASEGVEVGIRPLRPCLEAVGVGVVDLLKVDVEGLEDRVITPLLQGDAALHPKLIYFEDAHDGVWDLPLRQTLEATGYSKIRQFAGNSLYALRS